MYLKALLLMLLLFTSSCSYFMDMDGCFDRVDGLTYSQVFESTPKPPEPIPEPIPRSLVRIAHDALLEPNDSEDADAFKRKCSVNSCAAKDDYYAIPDAAKSLYKNKKKTILVLYDKTTNKEYILLLDAIKVSKKSKDDIVKAIKAGFIESVFLEKQSFFSWSKSEQ